MWPKYLLAALLGYAIGYYINRPKEYIERIKSALLMYSMVCIASSRGRYSVVGTPSEAAENAYNEAKWYRNGIDGELNYIIKNYDDGIFFIKQFIAINENRSPPNYTL